MRFNSCDIRLETGWLPSLFDRVVVLFQATRPYQWVKNGFVLIPLIFAKKLFDFPSLANSLQAAAIFCLVSGAVYLINDIRDVEADRRHPLKRKRPLTAGLISIRRSQVWAAVFLSSSLAWAAFLGREFMILIVGYLAVQILYNLRLKDVLFLDIFCISAGFLLRVAAGAAAIDVKVSSWLIVCTILLSLFLAVAKRKHEVLVLGERDAGNHRKVLSSYTPNLMDLMTAVACGALLLSYLLYCISGETVEKFQTDRMIFTFPFAGYGIFRFLYLIYKKNPGASPEKLFVSDAPSLANALLWSLSCLLIIYGAL